MNIETIITGVSTAFNVPCTKITGESRRRIPTEARHVAMYLAWKVGHLDKHIGDIFNRDRSTATYARHAVEDRMDAEPAFKERVEELERELKRNEA